MTNFFSSIDQSYQNANLGYDFAQNAEILCKGLLDANRRQSDESIQDSIHELYTNAERAQVETNRTAEMFLRNFRAICSVC